MLSRIRVDPAYVRRPAWDRSTPVTWLLLDSDPDVGDEVEAGARHLAEDRHDRCKGVAKAHPDEVTGSRLRHRIASVLDDGIGRRIPMGTLRQRGTGSVVIGDHHVRRVVDK